MSHQPTTLQTDRYHFFWGGPFSQWAPSRFVIDNLQYNCTEQYMMASKALMFGDQSAWAAIMDTESPRAQRELGRRVRYFDEGIWNANCRGIVERANYAKFGQNPVLLDALSATGDRKLVEASPEDCIWGIGRGAWEADIEDESTWLGTNWLGEALMQVRFKILRVPLP